MAGNYWIKLYIEILDDSKMAVLPDRLWRRVVELFLLAGRYHDDGQLPDTAELAWALRMPMDELDLDLRQISQIGIIERTPVGWNIPKFKVRQEPPPAERMRQSRAKKRTEQYHGVVTNCNNPVTQINRLTDTDTDNSSSGIFELYESTFGYFPQGILIEELKDYEQRHKAEHLKRAFEITAQQNKRSWAYTKTILDRWERDGYDGDLKKRIPNNNGSKPAEPERDIVAELIAEQKWKSR